MISRKNVSIPAEYGFVVLDCGAELATDHSNALEIGNTCRISCTGSDVVSAWPSLLLARVDRVDGLHLLVVGQAVFEIAERRGEEEDAEDDRDTEDPGDDVLQRHP